VKRGLAGSVDRVHVRRPVLHEDGHHFRGAERRSLRGQCYALFPGCCRHNIINEPDNFVVGKHKNSKFTVKSNKKGNVLSLIFIL
jgi:hypothetical protein